jgi:hypothetical protein
MTQPVVDRRKSLLGVPVVNPGVTWKEKADGRLTVAIPMRRKPGLLGWFQPQTWERRVELDPLGSFVLAQIDGKKNALQITEEFVARFKVHRREAELCIVAFLKSLLERCIISIAIS